MKKNIVVVKQTIDGEHYTNYKGFRVLVKNKKGAFVAILFSKHKETVNTIPCNSVENAVKSAIEMIDQEVS